MEVANEKILKQLNQLVNWEKAIRSELTENLIKKDT